MELPKFVKQNADYSLTVTLSREYSIGGEKRNHVTLREPTVGDQRQFLTSTRPSDREIADIEQKLLVSLADGLTPAEAEAMAMKDYARLQAAYLFSIDQTDDT